MQTPKPDQERPDSAREAATKRRVFAVGEIIGMKHLRTVCADVDKKPEEPNGQPR